MPYPHILLRQIGELERFASPRSGREAPPPDRDRIVHGRRIKAALEAAWEQARQNRETVQVVAATTSGGTYFQFRSDPDTTLFLKSLHSEKGIELRSVKQEDRCQLATVFVPDKKRKAFLNIFDRYLSEETKSGNPKHQALVNSIADVTIASVRSLWTDDPAAFPRPNERSTWEIWLRRRDDGSETTNFQNYAQTHEIEIATYFQRFPDRTIMLAKATPNQLADAIYSLDEIAELRRPAETAAFFRELGGREGNQWVQELLQRTTFEYNDESPAVCVLDTGVNREHPLLTASLDANDLHTHDPRWRVEDHHGHGTQMAGLALFGDLTELLQAQAPVNVAHRLESVKVLPPTGTNHRDLYGHIMAQAVSRVEIEVPDRIRTFSMAITDESDLRRGKPSTWSAEIDKLAGGFDLDPPDMSPRRLFFISGGNGHPAGPDTYLDACRTSEIHDPGQAWNALTVGAYTERDLIDDPQYNDWAVVAPSGGLSPISTTSCMWDKQWPIKPDVVLEGGNYAISPDGADNQRIPSLSLLTTYREPLARMFELTGDTSAATTQAARMGAIIQNKYPSLWPETIRALLVHSARWTPLMEAEVGPHPTRADMEYGLRTFGHGVPNLALALESTANNLTLIRQAEIRPFDNGKMYEMDLCRLPWPSDELSELGETPVRLRITLSYFIEPNPGEKGYKYKHRYASHGLRFEVNTPFESEVQFRKRLNKAAREEENEQLAGSGAAQWRFGPDLRSKGSIHTDVWEGTAIDLAQRNKIGVYPIGGWWKEQPKKGRWQEPCRYSLLVSIEAPEIETDLYVAIQNQIEIATLLGI